MTLTVLSVSFPVTIVPANKNKINKIEIYIDFEQNNQFYIEIWKTLAQLKNDTVTSQKFELMHTKR